VYEEEMEEGDEEDEGEEEEEGEEGRDEVTDPEALKHMMGMIMQQYGDADIGPGRKEKKRANARQKLDGSLRADADPEVAKLSHRSVAHEMDAFLRRRGIGAPRKEEEEGEGEGEGEEEDGEGEDGEEEEDEEEGGAERGMEGLRRIDNRPKKEDEVDFLGRSVGDADGNHAVPLAVLESAEDPVKFDYLRRAPRARWDCETVQDAVEGPNNTPTVIDAEEDEKESFLGGSVARRRAARKQQHRHAESASQAIAEEEADSDGANSDDDGGSGGEGGRGREGGREGEEDGAEAADKPARRSEVLVRRRGETKEEKAERKAAAKAIKAEHRAAKRAVRDAFATEKGKLATMDAKARQAGTVARGQAVFRVG
jgi:hypothetical protein